MRTHREPTAVISVPLCSSVSRVGVGAYTSELCSASFLEKLFGKQLEGLVSRVLVARGVDTALCSDIDPYWIYALQMLLSRPLQKLPDTVSAAFG